MMRLGESGFDLPRRNIEGGQSAAGHAVARACARASAISRRSPQVTCVYPIMCNCWLPDGVGQKTASKSTSAAIGHSWVDRGVRLRKWHQKKGQASR
jgi:hypothetical protein